MAITAAQRQRSQLEIKQNTFHRSTKPQNNSSISSIFYKSISDSRMMSKHSTNNGVLQSKLSNVVFIRTSKIDSFHCSYSCFWPLHYCVAKPIKICFNLSFLAWDIWSITETKDSLKYNTSQPFWQGLTRYLTVIYEVRSQGGA